MERKNFLLQPRNTDSLDVESLNSELFADTTYTDPSCTNIQPSHKKFEGYKFRWEHYQAILYRRYYLIKRSKKMVIITMLMTLGFTALAILARYLMETLVTEYVYVHDFNMISQDTNEIVIAADDESDDHIPYMEALASIFKSDTGRDPFFRNFTKREDLNEFMYKRAEANPKKIPLVAMGLVFNEYFPVLNFTTLHNTSLIVNVEITARVLAARMAWKKEFGKDSDFHFTIVQLMKKLIDVLFAQMGPYISVVGMISIIPLIITQPITDIRGEVRQYMVSCTLTFTPYWLAEFTIDIVIWIISVFMMWCVFLMFQIRAFMDNQANLLYALLAQGPGFILFSYCFSFLFSQPESASRQLFVILCVILIIPVIIDFAREQFIDPVWLDWLYGFIPPILMQRLFAQMFMHISWMKKGFSYYWTENKNTQAFLIMQLVEIPFFIFLLWFIEAMKKKLEKRDAQKTYGDYTQFFLDEKKKHPVTREAHELEQLVLSDIPFAVRIKDVSRLYFNTEGIPIAAVNSVSLGVKKGDLFGFLGANGAGKTTLIKMITSMIPVSNGVIEINGVDITKENDPTVLSICPQFNSHLCMEMTPLEHFELYRLLFRLDKQYATDTSTHLLNSLDLMKFADKPARELSGGNQRKLAIALSFYSPSSIVLLDEPTSSLDPVARHNVHELIKSYHNKKTFMLCTHLLSEAESLCDVISIMIKGCVYTYGTPEYLSTKFGTEYKIDLLLDDDSESTSIKVDRFFADNLPDAEQTIDRPKARIYTIPASSITLPDLFEKMSNGKKGDNGFNYYTCSSSSLERVFMEIVRISEAAEGDTKIVNPSLQSSMSEGGRYNILA